MVLRRGGSPLQPPVLAATNTRRVAAVAPRLAAQWLSRLRLGLILAAAGGVAPASAESAAAAAQAANVGISVMLLGSVGFMMTLFYLVNHTDQDMVKYSWKVISSTISIFSAVLLFQAFNGIVEKTFLEGASEQQELFVGVAHMLLWFAVLQLALAYISGAIGKAPEGRAQLDAMELQLKCYSVLLGHITGFAAINAFGVLQQQIPRNAVACCSVAPLAWLVVYLLGQITNRFRDTVALGDDGTVDEAEQKWDEVTEETEDDVIGLAVSFMVAQTLRFAICGTLPNPEGEEPEAELSGHSDRQTALLVGFGVVFVVVELVTTVYAKPLGRITTQMRNIIMMCFAWCIFFGSDWFLSYHFFRTEHGMIKEVALALFVTALSLAMIRLLDIIADMPTTDNTVDNAIRSVVNALGILIGFGWEKAFDTAVASVSESVKVLPETTTKMLLAICLAALVVPAWRHYILPTILIYEAEEEEEAEGGEEDAKHSESGLEAPLLAQGSKKPLAKGKSGLIMDPVALKKRCKEYRGHVEELEARNARLEASLADIITELQDLQKMANLLQNNSVP